MTKLNSRGKDAALARALRQRDPHALAELYDCYGPLVYRRVYNIVRNEALAEDLVQEVFLRVWTRAKSFDETRGSLSTWVQTIARNCAIDHVRSKTSQLERQTCSIDLQTRLDSRLSCENEAVRFDLFGRLTAAIGKLSFNQKTVLRLSFHEGFSHAEVAHRLQRPLGTVKSQIRSALDCLRAVMLEGGGLEIRRKVKVR